MWYKKSWHPILKDLRYNQENEEGAKMAENRQYDHEYKVQAVKLAREIGQAKAAKELGVPKNTMYGWMRANRLGNLDLGAGSQTPQSAMTLNEELIQLRQQVKEQEKEIRRLKKENDFLEEASAFFAASRLKSAKTKEWSLLQ